MWAPPLSLSYFGLSFIERIRFSNQLRVGVIRIRRGQFFCSHALFLKTKNGSALLKEPVCKHYQFAGKIQLGEVPT